MNSIFKAYDIRGEYGSQITEEIARKIGNAFGSFIGSSPIVLGRDVRVSSPSLCREIQEGIQDAGIDVITVGPVTTPALYYATGALEAAGGLMVTASHNPGKDNGFKLCGREARPIGSDSGLKEIQSLVESGRYERAGRSGTSSVNDIRKRYVEHILSFAKDVGPLRIATDTANGMVGTFLPDLLRGLPLVEAKSLFMEPDGSFPNHEPNPLVPANLDPLREAVRSMGADLGFAFDGDGDRCAVVDEEGTTVAGDLLTALIAREMLQRHPGSPIVYDLRSSQVVADEIRAAGGEPVTERTGHSFIKAKMRSLDSPFGGELSGHFYFRDNYYADSGLIAMVEIMVLATKMKGPFSEIVQPLRRFHTTGEINFRIQDPDAVMAQVEEAFRQESITRLDGITVRMEGWWFNLRKSNTEPLVRLNVEGGTLQAMEQGLERLQKMLGTPI
ncbi:MAG: phosphomannomutase/phosphoglucomutase [Planctomycetota bacterium]|nr:phosphomannomutase/phosphoglucomutase [Planctomycetota bacterium]